MTVVEPQRHDFYRQQPGDSLVFDGESYLEASLPLSKINPAALGFRVELYVDEQSSGEVLSLGDGVLSLKTQPDSSLRLQVNVSQSDGAVGPVTLDTEPLSPGWHTVAGVLDDGQLSLYLDTALQSTESIRSLALAQEEQDLAFRFGRQFIGALDNLELYDPGSAPLLSINDGSARTSSLTVTLDATGSAVVRLQSTGQMNQAYGASLAQRSVLMRSSAGTEDYVNLLSLDAYTALAGVYASTLYIGDEVPGIDEAALDRASWQSPDSRMKSVAVVGNFFISPAQAFFGLNTSRFLDDLSSLASLVLPINEIKEIWVQLSYLATDPQKFEPGELVINVISLATYFPALRPLQGVLKTLKRFYRRYGNKPYTKAMGGVIGDAFEELIKKKRADKLYSIVPYMMVMIEMIQYKEALEMMLDGIESNDDLWAWIDYLTLPEDGWEGDGPPPGVAFLDAVGQADRQVGSASGWMGFFMSDALAAKLRKPTGKRKDGKVVGFSIKQIKEQFPGIEARNFTQGIGVLASTLKSGKAENLRKISSAKSVMVGSAVLAKVACSRFKKFLQGRSGTRIPAPMFFAIVAYLELELQKGGYLDGLADAEHISRHIESKYATAMADILLPGAIVEESPRMGDDEFFKQYFGTARTIPVIINSSAHGSMFHLGMVAYFTSTRELKTTERSRWVGFYEDERKREGNSKKLRKSRTVDVVLKGDGKSSNTSEKWVELKSLQRKTMGNKYEPSSGGFKVWDANYNANRNSSKEYTYHKQFTLDRAAWKGNARLPAAQGNNKLILKVEDFQWLFHNFDVKEQKRYSIKASKNVEVGSVSNRKTIRYWLSEYPENINDLKWVSNKALKFSLDLQGVTQSSTERRELAGKIDEFDLLKVLTLNLKAAGLLTQDMLNEL